MRERLIGVVGLTLWLLIVGAFVFCRDVNTPFLILLSLFVYAGPPIAFSVCLWGVVHYWRNWPRINRELRKLRPFAWHPYNKDGRFDDEEEAVV